MFDLGPAADEMTRLVIGVRDDQLDHPTPCSEWRVADLLAHVHQFSHVFTQNARKEPVDPAGHAGRRLAKRSPRATRGTGPGVRNEAAWQGRVSAGGIQMDAADNGIVAIEELTVHGWDLAHATGQPIAVEDSGLVQVEQFLTMFGGQEPGEGPFGPSADVPADATRLERVIAQTGRDPRWSAPSDDRSISSS